MAADEDDPMRRGALQFWEYRGVILAAGDGPRGSGTIKLDELLEFAECVKMRMPDATILVHQCGLRAVQSDRAKGLDEPRLEWRDWD